LFQWLVNWLPNVDRPNKLELKFDKVSISLLPKITVQMKSLVGKNFFVLFFLCASMVVSCKKENNTTPANSNPDLATVTTDRIEAITYKSATVVSTVSEEGKSAVIGMGIAYGKNPNPTVVADNNVPYASFGVGTFSTNLNNLEIGTTYYVRSYATNAVGTAYSEQKSFTTVAAKAPTITTTEVTNITIRSAMSGGSVVDQGSSPIVEHGLVWSTDPAPTLSSGGKAVSASPGTGTFLLEMSGLMLSTKYYVRAYATNGELTGYGNEISFTTAAGITDVDGNVYETIQIGTQTWMKENLKTSKYRDGSVIPTGLSNNEWKNATTDAYAIYNNDAANNTTYGKLYNWFTVADPRGLCPAGWHVPTDAEWTTLENFLGESPVAGGKMKAVSSLWQSPNTGATNESGFSALPGGGRYGSGQYSGVGFYGGWWASSEYSSGAAWFRSLGFSFGSSARYDYGKHYGFSVRCLRD
jgi:uncharacterized protein (TIGR02145 family)